MNHIPVLLQEVIEQLKITPSGVFVDVTLGGGSHAYEIAKRIPKGHLYGFDQDPYALTRAKEKLQEFNNVTFIASNFRQLKEELVARHVTAVDGILMDIGVSSFQLDDPKRGFSYHQDAFLDMRMNPNQETTAATVVNTYSKEALKQLFTRGEVPFTNRLVDKIIDVREEKPIQTTLELVDLIQQVAPRVEKKKRHPARLVFQALRMEVNQELQVLEEAVTQAMSLLKSGGRLAVITFHSLEDRFIKQTFQQASTVSVPAGVPIPTKDLQADFLLVTKKPIIASEAELNQNSRSSSAKLRVLERR